MECTKRTASSAAQSGGTDGCGDAVVGVDVVSELLKLREPARSDGLAVYHLIRSCPPLDVNSPYAYFLLCDHFRQTTVVAEGRSGLVGCLTAYIRPDASDVLFVWQVAVHPDARGRGVGRQLIDAALMRPVARDVRWVETTVSPSNMASRRLFASWAKARGAAITESPYLEAMHFGTAGAHESEPCLRIGPLNVNPVQEVT